MEGKFAAISIESGASADPTGRKERSGGASKNLLVAESFDRFPLSAIALTLTHHALEPTFLTARALLSVSSITPFLLAPFHSSNTSTGAEGTTN
jgi:hypothetical protein